MGEFINFVRPFYSKKVDDELIPLLILPYPDIVNCFC